jgi:hypothetical protein
VGAVDAPGASSFRAPPGGGADKSIKRRKNYEHVDGKKPCGKGAQGSEDFCFAHGGGKSCEDVDDDGKACGTGGEGKTDLCVTRGGASVEST